MYEKVVRDGKVAILVSAHFGGGWSTWNSDFKEILMFDKRLVEACENRISDIDPIINEIFGDNYIFTGGWDDTQIHWLPEGTIFYIEEYDGRETLIDSPKSYFIA